MTSHTSETIIPFPNDGDPLDGAGRSVLGLLQRAAAIAEESSKHALDIAHKLSHQLRAAEDQIRELQADIQYYKDRADRAEQWLHKISAEIEQRFFASAESHSQQARTRRTGPQDYVLRKNSAPRLERG